MSSTKGKAESEKPYELTAHERAILDKRKARREHAAPGMKRVPHGRRVRPDHPDLSVGYMLIFEELGLGWDEGHELLRQLIGLATRKDLAKLPRTKQEQ
jgi:hypothetical protein